MTLHSSVDATAHEVMGRSLLTAASGAAAQLKELHSAIDLKPALRLMLEFSVECKDLRAAVEQLGGVVLHEYKNAPAMSAAVPLDRISQVRELPGMKRVRKSKTVSLAK